MTLVLGNSHVLTCTIDSQAAVASYMHYRQDSALQTG